MKDEDRFFRGLAFALLFSGLFWLALIGITLAVIR